MMKSHWLIMLVAAQFLVACSDQQTVTPPRDTAGISTATQSGATPTNGEAIAPAGAIASSKPTPFSPSEATTPPVESSTQLQPTERVTSIALELVADGLVAPLVLTHANDGSGRLFVADQIGVIYVLSPEGGFVPTPFLDLRDRIISLDSGYDERGLLGLAFHPDYPSNGRLFVYYSAPRRPDAPSNWNHTSHISEFHVSADPNVADLGSERILIQIDQPQANHNGGQIAFGPDGYLYIPLGDGGAAGDVGRGHPPQGNGQDTTTLLGSILRIDINTGDPYAIPPDNPFADGGGAPEIYAYGFRNPYRISFDLSGDGALYAGDVGQDAWEEVDLVTQAGNYGWNIREGTHCFNPPQDCSNTGAAGEPLIQPIIEFENSNQAGGLGLVVIGGNIYRGSAIPGLAGHYVFGTWSADWINPSGMILVATPGAPGQMWSFEPPTISTPSDASFYVLSFGEDANHELYVLTEQNMGPSGSTGRVWRIVP